jgi:hypothetical protein
MWALVLFLSLSAAPADIHEVSRGMKLRLVEIINRDRATAGLKPVEFSDELSRAAGEHAREMLREGYSSHWNRAGWKPYLRYAAAGIRDATAENIWSLWHTNFPLTQAAIWEWMQKGHQSFMDEVPPNDGHRQNVLNPWHTHVGIGVAYDASGVRMVQVFSARYAELDPLPLRATVNDALFVEGRVLRPRWQVAGISILYEPLPKEMSYDELRVTTSYSLPSEEHVERPRLEEGFYVDRSRGTILLDPPGRFRVRLNFWKGEPGVYTVAVWLKPPGERPVIGAMASLLVERRRARGGALLPQLPPAAFD